ncbi:6-phosphogluconolactonase [Bradyrhizobium sp. U87765 SZCCT0131]|uniref:6-phosphogluconolactonase n=1 Tax=unclassified Bradyrhizobium TaxID=2631580 RepID=UPI001BA83639|nr:MULTISPECIES: 6-phosphogluconolactonase [unclassified Bradyrhizobium]MBR1218315.1 6-phosphogluconolactonase [Bradyrhizobium sp. U87765 SZCCT0131]MBR1260739.1 6-phosphogluconolactonase [Bradyrhizobium sp. U87765 SZCCT0134]MBR1303813.1 6-phosphogluconolactonase [Bradyrhizobium sp. U87765 SZCCT0110]MBR1319419.1 6-phosphogluconolactonase [Bradyrhizobium sp. U87765 SZCCT0109]MBR1347744.1 6-phosphogluconolactonase [Bradyrhizobium sp. U87765 SZCCT0048]
MTAPDPRHVIVRSDPAALAEVAAQRLVDRIATSAVPAAVCLTGGSTPRRLYELLATPPWRDRIPWSQVHWFIGDDRFVAQDDPLSNIGMARRAFLDTCAAPGTVHAIPTGAATPDEAADGYARTLTTFHASQRGGRPLFDLVLLGIGPDGHVASLFPNDAAALAERRKWVVGVPRANVSPFVPRVSLTFTSLASTSEMLFVVAGHDKQAVLQRLIAGADLPAAHARASDGETVWLIDEAARPANLNVTT